MEDQKKSTATKDKLWTLMFILLVGVAFFTFMTGQGLNSGTTVYIDRLGGTALLSGYLAAIFSVAAGLARMSCGTLMDSYGRRIFIVGGSSLLFIGTFGFIFLHGDIAMVVWRTLQGIGYGTITTAMSTAAADVLPMSRLGEGLGYFGLAQALAMAIGPGVALTLATMDPAELIYMGLSATSFSALVIGIIAHYEKNPLKLPATCAYRMRWEAAQQDGQTASAPDADVAQSNTPARDDAAKAAAPNVAGEKPHGSLFSRIFEKSALPGTIPYTLLNPMFGFGIFFVGLYGTKLGVGNPGVFFTLCAISMLILRARSGAFMDKTPSIVVYTIAVIGGLACCLLLIVAGVVEPGTTPSALLFYSAGIGFGVCMGLGMPVCQTISVKGTPPERWGAANALFLLSQDVGICLAVIIWGAINDAFGFQASLVGCLICVAISYVSAWAWFPAQEKRWTR